MYAVTFQPDGFKFFKLFGVDFISSADAVFN